jgi:toxin ParE1/3/4
MKSFTVTRKARADIKSISIYTQKRWGKGQRKLYAKQFDEAFHMLAENPEVGKDCDYIKSGYKKFPHASHVIFFRSVSNEGIEIVRILHKRMDARSRLTIS